MKRALRRAGYIALKSNPGFPIASVEIELIRTVYLRILEHAMNLGWIADTDIERVMGVSDADV